MACDSGHQSHTTRITRATPHGMRFRAGIAYRDLRASHSMRPYTPPRIPCCQNHRKPHNQALSHNAAPSPPEVPHTLYSPYVRQVGDFHEVFRACVRHAPRDNPAMAPMEPRFHRGHSPRYPATPTAHKRIARPEPRQSAAHKRNTRQHMHNGPAATQATGPQP